MELMLSSGKTLITAMLASLLALLLAHGIDPCSLVSAHDRETGLDASTE